MQKYRRVALGDRYQIQAYISSGLTASEIASCLGFHKSTIFRELRRNGAKSYDPVEANGKAQARFSLCKRRYKISAEDAKEFVLRRLEVGWSPNQISTRLAIEESSDYFSYQTIYRFVRRLGLKKTHLHFGYKRWGQGRIIHRRASRQSSWKQSIHDRPEVANLRSEIGHWERDLFFTKARKTVIILTDRKSRYTLLAKNPNFRSSEVAALTTKLLKRAKIKSKTITNDNGSEFFDVSSMKVPVYFCDVLKPGQRGTVENTIGLLRRFIKRDTDLSKISDRELRELEKQINLRPRRCLDYKTPFEVFFNTKVALAV